MRTKTWSFLLLNVYSPFAWPAALLFYSSNPSPIPCTKATTHLGRNLFRSRCVPRVHKSVLVHPCHSGAIAIPVVEIGVFHLSRLITTYDLGRRWTR